jgi:hypothetical protein
MAGDCRLIAVQQVRAERPPWWNRGGAEVGTNLEGADDPGSGSLAVRGGDQLQFLCAHQVVERIRGKDARAVLFRDLRHLLLHLGFLFGGNRRGRGCARRHTRTDFHKLSLQASSRNKTEEARGHSGEVVEDMRSPAWNVYR